MYAPFRLGTYNVSDKLPMNGTTTLQCCRSTPPSELVTGNVLSSSSTQLSYGRRSRAVWEVSFSLGTGFENNHTTLYNDWDSLVYRDSKRVCSNPGSKRPGHGRKHPHILSPQMAELPIVDFLHNIVSIVRLLESTCLGSKQVECSAQPALCRATSGSAAGYTRMANPWFSIRLRESVVIITLFSGGPNALRAQARRAARRNVDSLGL